MNSGLVVEHNFKPIAIIVNLFSLDVMSADRPKIKFSTQCIIVRCPLCQHKLNIVILDRIKIPRLQQR